MLTYLFLADIDGPPPFKPEHSDQYYYYTLLLSPENRPWIYLILGGFVALVVLLVLRRILHSRRKAARPMPPELRIELAKLGGKAPPAEPPILEFYNLPMRLAGIVLAPVGRMRELPPPEELPAVFESVLPGLDRVADRHRPLVGRWPNQVSTRGFASAFFSNIRLPGEGGKGTPWSAVAGILSTTANPLCSASFSVPPRQTASARSVVNTEHEWLGCLRVKQ